MTSIVDFKIRKQDPAHSIYVYAAGPDGDGIVVSLVTALAHVPESAAASCAGNWGEFARLVPDEAAAHRAAMRGKATWGSWEDYRDDRLDEDEPPTEAEIRAAYEALDWRTEREPLDTDGIDLMAMVEAGWDHRNEMYDPYRAMGWDLPAPIVDAFVTHTCGWDSLDPIYALGSEACEESLGRAFARIGCLLIRDDTLLDGFWDGFADFAACEKVMAGYLARIDALRAAVPAPEPGALAFDDPDLFADILADPYGEDLEEDGEDEGDDEPESPRQLW